MYPFLNFGLADGDNVEVSAHCPECSQLYKFTIPIVEFQIGLEAYTQHHKMMQEAFKNVSDTNREFMISGFCPTCWDKAFEDEIDVDDSEFRLLEETLRIVEDPNTLYEEVDDFADVDDFEEDDFFLPTEFPKDDED